MKELMNSPIQTEYYLKGRVRYWFWVLPAYIALILAAPYLSNYLTVYLSVYFRNKGLLAAVATANTVFMCIGWAAIFLLYGLYNRIKTFRTVFILLFCAQILYSGYLFFSGYFGLMLHKWNQISPILIIQAISYLIYYIVWMIAAVIMLASKHSNTILRVSAAFVLSIVIFTTIFKAASEITTAISICIDALKYIAFAFFLGAMSFSKMKQPKTLPLPPVSSVSLGERSPNDLS
jgi:hypothetical protein